MNLCRERAVTFGDGATLVGVVSEPLVPPSGAAPPVVVMLNAGILHHVGTCRMHVRIARRLAEHGFTALRFDFSGIGDSEPRSDALPFAESALLEVHQAMDHLAATRGAGRFVLFGLCSGADIAFATTRHDPRVVGLAQFDGFAFRTNRFWVHHYARRLKDARAWQGFAKRLISRARRTVSGGPDPGPGPRWLREFPPQDQVSQDLRALIRRRVQQLYVYTGGFSGFYNYRAQFRDVFRAIPFENMIDVEYLPAADHILTGATEQASAIEIVAGWMRRHWEAPAEGLSPAPPQRALAG